MAERARQARDLLLAGEGELRQARPGDHVHAGDQRLDQRPHGGGADQQRFLAAALVEEPVGEDVAAVEIGGELDLVDGDEGEVEVARHRLDGRDPVARPVRLDLLLAGDERDVGGAGLVDDPLVDLAREEPQRQADHAALVAEHALDGEMGLAGIGRPEHSGDAAGAQLRREVTAGDHGEVASCCHATRPGRRGRRPEPPGTTMRLIPRSRRLDRDRSSASTRRTCLERNGPESPTRRESAFVHGAHMGDDRARRHPGARLRSGAARQTRRRRHAALRALRAGAARVDIDV